MLRIINNRFQKLELNLCGVLAGDFHIGWNMHYVCDMVNLSRHMWAFCMIHTLFVVDIT